MLAPFVFILAIALALRSLLLAIFEKKSLALKSVDGLLCAFFLLIATVLSYSTKKSFDFKLVLFLPLVFIPLGLRLKRKRKASVMTRGVLFAVFCVLCAGAFTLSAFHRFTEEKPLARLIITGEEQTKKHRVILQWDGGKEEFYLLGDLVAIRVKTLRFASWINFLGYDNLFTIEAIYGSYRHMADLSTLPVNGYEISHPPIGIIHRWLWKKWEALFFQKKSCSWIQSASLESNFFPLVSHNGGPCRGDYLLTIRADHLSSIADASSF